MAANPTRTAFTNAVIDAALASTGDGAIWIRDVPNGYVSAMFPDRISRTGEINPDNGGKLLITPAMESDNGRGQVFFDVYCEDLDGLEVGISLKVSNYKGDDRPPRNSIIAGSKAEHYFGLTLAAKRGAVLPVLQYWQDAGGQWWRCCFDAGRVLRESEHRLTDGWRKLLHTDMPNVAAEQQIAKITAITGSTPTIAALNKGGAVAISPLSRSGGRYCYLNVKINHDPAGHEYTAVDAPRMPSSYSELLDWMGEAGEMIG